VPLSLQLEKLPGILRDGLARLLNSILHCLETYSKGSDYCIPETFHVSPLGLDIPVTVVYPSGVPEADLESERRQLHKVLCLPEDRPLFRRGNSVDLTGTRDRSGFLYTTHIGLNPSGVVGGEEAVVQGKYTYHHYMQDNIDDNGWGCAYRSLQTLVSWFRHQGYTNQPIPSHREIQQTLVDIGDKPPSFAGTRKWIGALEVSFTLEKLLGVTNRILAVQSGEELAFHGQELVNHFKTQGTPIMIGGGVLAHTILGVHYNGTSGEIKFLILDPHYTGAEDLQVIHNKGWCGWKNLNFWDKSAFYNLCMPQRPRMV